jgi:hypothetical protein
MLVEVEVDQFILVPVHLLQMLASAVLVVVEQLILLEVDILLS